MSSLAQSALTVDFKTRITLLEGALRVIADNGCTGAQSECCADAGLKPQNFCLPCRADAALRQDKEIWPNPFAPEQVKIAVVRLDLQRDGLRSLCGIILSTLKVNRERGQLTAHDNAFLDELIARWNTEYEKLTH